MQAFQNSFIELARTANALSFGSFELKSGRISPYFFNAGKFSSGALLAGLADCYAQKILATESLNFDMLFGPAYKGIPLVAATAALLSHRYGRDVPFAFNRKEKKGHGEGGLIVGAELSGRVLILDDVITAGTAIRQSIDIITGAENCSVEGVLIGLDRQETGPTGISAIQQLEQEQAVPVHAIVQLNDLIDYLSNNPDGMSTGSHHDLLNSMNKYREVYGTKQAEPQT